MTSPYLVPQLLTHSAEQRPDHPFLIQDGLTVTYEDLEKSSNRVARVILDRGVSQGDRVGLLARNSPCYVEAYYGIQKAGCIAVPLNTAANASMLAGVLENCGACLLIAGPGFEKLAGQVGGACQSLSAIAMTGGARIPKSTSGAHAFDLARAGDTVSSQSLDIQASESDPCNISYTSGSTGTPRGVTLSHLNILTNARSIVSYLELNGDDRVLQVLPFYYGYGQSLLNTHALVGGTVVIENRFMYPDLALDTLKNERCTGFSGVPSNYAILLNRTNFAEREFPDLRYVTTSGAAMSPAIARRLMEALPDKRIFMMYGSTEAAARLSCLLPQDLPQKLGSIGKAIPGVELRVLRDDGTETDDGEQGEIVARGKNIMIGYWDDNETTEQVMDEHGYHTGDYAYRDEDGFLFIVGRGRDFIKVGAHRVSTKEIEDMIGENHDVHEVAVVGAPDEILGEKVCAFVVPAENTVADVERLKRALRKTLPVYEVPSEIYFLPDLPKNESGKIIKQDLLKYARQRG